MKTNREQKHLEDCHTSLEYLCQRVKSYLAQEHDILSPWVLDQQDWDEHPLARSSSSGEIIDVVLFGSFLRRFFESGSWPQKKYRFWVLSHAVKKVMVELLGLPSESISVISRESILGQTASALRTIDYSESFDLVYAGRLGPVKNIESLVALTYYLQKDHRAKVTLKLFGDFEDTPHEYQGRRVPSSYRQHIESFVKSFKWPYSPPIFYGKLAPDQWPIHRELNRPCFISLSTFMGEDFGVSIAQAQELGWPLILSKWGAHYELGDYPANYFSSDEIGQSFQHSQAIKVMSRILANKLIAQSPTSSQKNSDDSIPQTVTISELDNIRRSVVKKWGLSTLYINREQTNIFADTKSGGLFFEIYRKIFSHDSDQINNWLVITLDRNEYESSANLNESEVISSIGKRAYEQQKALRFISSREIHYPEHLHTLANTKTAYLTLSGPTLEKVLLTLLKLLPVDSVVYCREPHFTEDSRVKKLELS